MSHEEKFIKEPFVNTTFTTKSGLGTPMFSRPGAQTTAEYICFKEPHNIIKEVDEDENIPESIIKQQVLNDLNSLPTDIKALKLKENMKKQK